MEVKIFNEAMRDLSKWGYKTSGAAGIDLCACIEGELSVYPGEVYRIHTGVGIHIISKDLVGLVSLRSGFRGGLIMPNSPGVIDSDYQGEILIKVTNVSHNPMSIRPFERFAQMVIVPVYSVNVFEIVEEFSEPTERGTKGFGSTGK